MGDRTGKNRSVFRMPQIVGFRNFSWKKSEERELRKKLEKLLLAQAATIEFIRLGGDKKLRVDGRRMEEEDEKLSIDSPG